MEINTFIFENKKEKKCLVPKKTLTAKKICSKHIFKNYEKKLRACFRGNGIADTLRSKHIDFFKNLTVAKCQIIILA